MLNAPLSISSERRVTTAGSAKWRTPAWLGALNRYVRLRPTAGELERGDLISTSPPAGS
jgi:hypothetical protein